MSAGKVESAVAKIWCLPAELEFLHAVEHPSVKLKGLPMIFVSSYCRAIRIGIKL